jgi:phasin
LRTMYPSQANLTRHPTTPGRRVRKSAGKQPSRISAMTTNPAKIADTPFKTMAQNGSSQAKEASETMSRVTAESADLIKHFYVTGLKGAHEYNAKVMECAKSNTEASFSFVQKLADVKSPSDFLELATDYSRRQFETLTEQTKDLTALAQKVTIATVEPLKSAVSKSFGR